MPDINQSNPLVLQYLIQNAIWWIEFADLDGYRVILIHIMTKKPWQNGQKQSQMNT